MPIHKRALRIVGIVLAVYAVLVASHRGEFWPFSIYPMFSQAGTPWTRSLVRQVPEDRPLSWETTTLENLPGEAFPVAPRGINQNDVANYVSKTTDWTPKRLRGLRSIFAATSDFDPPLLILRVRGVLEDNSVSVSATPFLLFTPDSTAVNPTLDARRPTGSRPLPVASQR